MNWHDKRYRRRRSIISPVKNILLHKDMKPNVECYTMDGKKLEHTEYVEQNGNILIRVTGDMPHMKPFYIYYDKIKSKPEPIKVMLW